MFVAWGIDLGRLVGRGFLDEEMQSNLRAGIRLPDAP
jgi:hypothetical protein